MGGVKTIVTPGGITGVGHPEDFARLDAWCQEFALRMYREVFERFEQEAEDDILYRDFSVLYSRGDGGTEV